MNPQEHDNSITLSCHRRRGDSRRQTPLDNQAEASWQCPVCNTLSSGMFCPVCGYRQETTLRQKAVPREPRRTPSGITLVLAVSAALVLVLLVFVCIGVFFSSPSHKKVPLSQTDLPSYYSSGASSETSIPETPPAQPEAPVVSTVSLPAIAGKIAWVEPMLSSVAVLYTDGTVGVCGDEALAEKTASWRNVIQIWCTADGIVGLQENGEAVSTFLDLSEWQDVRDICVSYDWAAGITEQGTVLTAGNWDYPEDPAQWTQIRSLLLCQDCLYGVREDGSVVGAGYPSQTVLEWQNVQELYDFYQGQGAILTDGSVVSSFDEPAKGLRGSTKLIHQDGVTFGLSEDGTLLTGTGKLYHNGNLYIDNAFVPDATSIDLSQYRNIQDIFDGGYAVSLLILNRDGTVDTINSWTEFDLSSWAQIITVCAPMVDLEPRIYGLRSDGSVVVAAGVWESRQMNNYQGWNLRALFCGDGGVVGVTVDGKLVGDGTYAYISSR